MGVTSNWLKEHSISAHANISASTIALDLPAPLSLTFTPLLKRRGIHPVKPKHKHVLISSSLSLRCALKGRLCYVDYPRTMTQCMPLNALNVWINFKWTRGGHLHHSVTFVFVLMWHRVGIMLIGHITDPSVISPVWRRVKKGLSRLFILNHFVPLFSQ